MIEQYWCRQKKT